MPCLTQPQPVIEKVLARHAVPLRSHRRGMIDHTNRIKNFDGALPDVHF